MTLYPTSRKVLQMLQKYGVSPTGEFTAAAEVPSHIDVAAGLSCEERPVGKID